MRARIAVAVLLLLSVSAGAQKQAPYVESFEVRIHNVDVVVTDKQGATVRGLTRSDFEIAENGKPQPISNFAAYDEGSSLASGGETTPAAAPTSSPRQRRTFVLYIDEMALHPLSRQRIISSASDMVRESMQPGDEAMIVAPASAEKVVLPPTGDKNAVLAKLAEVVGENYFRAKTQTGSENFFLESQRGHAGSEMERRQIQQVYAGMVRKRVEQRLGQIRSAVAALRNIEGKKVLVLLTASLAATPGLDSAQSQEEAAAGSLAPSVESMMAFGSGGQHVPEEGRDWFDLRPLLADIGRTAAANGVTIYGMQPETPLDLAVGEASSTQRGGARGSTGSSSSGRSFSGELASTQITFETLANETGGGWFRGGRLGDGFRQISSDLRSYYSLAYRATGDAGKGRRVEVRVKGRPELRVRTRSEVVERTIEDEMDDLTVASLYYPRRINELGIHVEIGTVRHSGRTATVPVVVKVPLANLTLLPAKDLYRGSFRLHFAAAGENADFTANQDREQVIEVPAAELEASRKRYFTYETELRFDSGPGRYRIAVGVIDPISHLSGFSTLAMSLK
jgi:VWFA-related protein